MTEPSSALSLTPVAVRARRDGWTPERQIAFIAALAETRCVLKACRSVGKSAEAAYRLSRRPDAQSFRVAWSDALRFHPSVPSTLGQQWQLSASPGSSTSKLSTSASAPAPPPGAQPAYSLEAFLRVTARSSLGRRVP